MINPWKKQVLINSQRIRQLWIKKKQKKNQVPGKHKSIIKKQMEEYKEDKEKELEEKKKEEQKLKELIMKRNYKN